MTRTVNRSAPGVGPAPLGGSGRPALAWLDLRVPPPLVALLVGAIMWALARADIGEATAAGWPAWVRVWVSAAASTGGGLLALAGIVTFTHRRTTIDPLHPGRATALVTGGPYALTRNPMYVGLLAVLVGWALRLDAWPALPGPGVFWLYIGRFQIAPEERALGARFGPAYAAYRRRVRRWL